MNDVQVLNSRNRNENMDYTPKVESSPIQDQVKPLDSTLRAKSFQTCPSQDQVRIEDASDMDEDFAVTPKNSLLKSDNSDSKNSVTLLGLHACADLSPLMIQIFEHCENISSMVLLSCCYHKLRLQDSVQGRYLCCLTVNEISFIKYPL